MLASSYCALAPPCAPSLSHPVCVDWLLVSGSSALQTSTTHGVLLVDDDPFWLPYSRGSCSNVYALLKTAPDTLLDISLLWFQKDALGTLLAAANPTYQWVSGDVPTTYTVTFPQ